MYSNVFLANDLPEGALHYGFLSGLSQAFFNAVRLVWFVDPYGFALESFKKAQSGLDAGCGGILFKAVQPQTS